MCQINDNKVQCVLCIDIYILFNSFIGISLVLSYGSHVRTYIHPPGSQCVWDCPRVYGVSGVGLAEYDMCPVGSEWEWLLWLSAPHVRIRRPLLRLTLATAARLVMRIEFPTILAHISSDMWTNSGLQLLIQLMATYLLGQYFARKHKIHAISCLRGNAHI